MKFIKIELQITILSLFIAAAVSGSGYLVYESLSQIIDSIHKEARPDLKLLIIKDISSDLNEAENSVRLYSLTGNDQYIYKFQKLNKGVQKKLTNLEDYIIPETDQIQQIDSIRLLSNRKLLLLSQIRNLHKQKISKPTTPLTDLYSKIDTVIIQPDTIKFEPVRKKGLIKRIFGKQDTTTKAPIIIDKSEEKEALKQELAEVEQQMSTENQELQSKEKVLYERNIAVNKQLNKLISKLEADEQRHLETKTEEADFMAAQIYRRLVLFTGASIVLLIIVLILFFRNLQKNKTYQNMLKKGRLDAENLAKAKERFVATVSHEMRTPVNAIYGLSEQMLLRVSDPTMKADLDIVHKSADHLITLVNDTLDFSKIESRKMTFEQIDFVAADLFREVITLHQVPARSKGLELELINSIPEHRVYKGDPVRLKQILINLFTNAIKFTYKGKVSLEATEEKLAGHHYQLIIDVLDSGIGISEKNLPKIFEEFVQLDTDDSQKHRGAGLGLAIVKKLVDLQGGKIKVKSLVGKGTRFTVEIPYPEGDPQAFNPQKNKQLSVPDWFQQLHLLLVDDEDFNLYLLKNILGKWNVNYTEAHNGLEAVNLCKTEQYDLILMDMRMPVMDGYEASRQIIQQNPNALIAALTATKRTEDQAQLRQAGIRMFLQKPFPERVLYDILIELKTRHIPEPPVQNTLSTTRPTFDFEDLKTELGGDETFFREMIDLFIQSAKKCRSGLTKANDEKDSEAVAEAAHKLAPPAKHMQANQLYDILKELEIHGNQANPDWPAMETKIRKAEEEINALVSLLTEHITK